MEAQKERSIITDKVVLAKTNKTIVEWFTILDGLGAKQMEHLAIFNLISSIDGLSPLGEWNHNLLATSYEWDRGLKARGQKGKDFEISVSKTVEVPISTLYESWVDDTIRRQWLNEEMVIRKATSNKSARISWNDGITSLSVDFYLKGTNKSQVVVQHLKIVNVEGAAAMKTFWGKALDQLKMFLESGKRISVEVD